MPNKTLEEFKKEDEALCTKCGKCCKDGMPVAKENGEIELQDCQYLNKDNTCSIYDKREKEMPYWCTTIDDGRRAKTLWMLPDDCPYKEET